MFAFCPNPKPDKSACGNSTLIAAQVLNNVTAIATIGQTPGNVTSGKYDACFYEISSVPS
jgi:hypothetical protein